MQEYSIVLGDIINLVLDAKKVCKMLLSGIPSLQVREIVLLFIAWS